ncbi:hypothetical protein HU200_001881 [Digitaria exilis]|nr:hypothetical protein HU200_001881 [Digitaria exilis]
MMHPHL